MPRKQEATSTEPYAWAFNPVKLQRAKKYVADLEEMRLAGTPMEQRAALMEELSAGREEAVKARYVENQGFITGSRKIRPQPPRHDDEEEDDD